MRRIAALLAVTAGVALWLAFLAPRALGGPVTLVWVNGTSMEPTLHGGDLAILYDGDDYGTGDVVAFEIPEGGIVIHRILAASEKGYRFQGDNRDQPDPWVLPTDAIIGRQVLAVPRGARALAMLRRPLPLALLSSAMVFVWLLRDRRVVGEDVQA